MEFSPIPPRLECAEIFISCAVAREPPRGSLTETGGQKTSFSGREIPERNSGLVT